MEYPDFITWGLRAGMTRGQVDGLWAAQFAAPTYTWATRPAASSVPAGAEITISDVGNVGPIRFRSDGTNWRPANGSAVLWRRVGSLASPTATITGSGAAQSFAVPDTMSIPPGMLIPGVSRLNGMAKARRIGAAGASGSVQIRLGTGASAGINDNSLVAQTMGATTLLDTFLDGTADVTSTTSYTSTGFLARNGGPNSSSFADRTTNFDCSVSNLVSLGVSSAFTVDQMALLGYEITLLG